MVRRRPASRGARPWVLLLLLGGALFAVGVWVGRRPGRPAEPTPAAPPVEVPVDVPAAPPAPAAGARVALVIDDLGRSLADLDRLAALRIPIAYAVLPFESVTAQVVERLRERGEEVLCHLPMEGQEDADPGPGALRGDMSPAELVAATEAALAGVPGAVGVNNHMGSSLSADRRAMRTILSVLAARGLFFLDSRTTAASTGYEVALELGVPAARRQVFLDPDPRAPAVAAQFQRLLTLAAEQGAVVAIGHPRPATLAVLAEQVPRARALGYEFVPLSYLLDRPGAAPE